MGADEILHEVQHGEGARKVGRPFCNGVEGGCEEVLRPAEGAGIHKHGFVQAPAALAEHSAACSRERDAGALDERHRLAAADADLEARSQAREGEDLQQLGGRKRRTVAVIGGGMVGCETAEYLAARGCKVSVIEMMDKIAAGESTTILPTLLENYKTYGVEQYPSHKVKEFRMDAVVCENKDGAEVTIPCDYIVLAMGARSNEFDAAALEAASIPVYSIGDAAGKAADISNAIRTGYDTACQL